MSAPARGPGAAPRGADPARTDRGEAAAVLAVTGLAKRYRPEGAPALAGVSLGLHAGEFVAVLGANGSGKSTLLRCVVGLARPDAGAVRLLGNDLTRQRGARLRASRLDLALIFQDSRLVSRRTAVANAASGALGRHRGVLTRLGRLPRDELRHAADTLERVGVGGVARQRADTLSGGQAQRVAIARALCQRPAVLLADEPVASLDPDAGVEVMRLLSDLTRQEHLAVVCVLHQPELALRFADRVVGLACGRLAFDAPSAEVTAEQVSRLYRVEPPVAAPAGRVEHAGAAPADRHRP